MLVFVVGTTAELIKVAPVWCELEARGVQPRLWYTGQHGASAMATLAALGLPAPHRWLAGGSEAADVARPLDVPAWMAKVAVYTARHRKYMRVELAVDGRSGLILVHGDTFTTILGAVIGHILRVEVAHVEAGMRSGSWKAPFPEEVNRRLVSRLAGLHFAPSPREVSNLTGVRGEVVDTGANTVVDALKLVAALPSPLSERLPDRYGLVTLHRFELVRDGAKLTEVFEALGRASRELPLVMLVGSSEQARLSDLGLLDRLPKTVIVASKLPYAEFLAVLGGAELVITDSGGLQQECHYLGVPCLIYRERTETHAGLGRSAVLSGMRPSAIAEFVSDPARYVADPLVDCYHPSKIVADKLVAAGYAAAGA